jgi:hypothetical protein
VGDGFLSGVVALLNGGTLAAMAVLHFRLVAVERKIDTFLSALIKKHVEGGE